MGHACIEVHEFWSEPIILWIAINVLPTGRFKSTFHHFLNNELEKVNKEVQEEGKEPKPMQLPHCTWEKFGDILANSGARCIGLFDELVSFFLTMNMYFVSINCKLVIQKSTRTFFKCILVKQRPGKLSLEM